MFSVTFPDVITVPSERRGFRDQIDCLSDPTKIPLSLIDIPGARRVSPNPIEVVTRTRREDEATHFAAWARLRFRR